MSTTLSLPFPKLNNHNYLTTWRADAEGLLRSKGLWRLVKGDKKRPTGDDADAKDKWDDSQEIAAGLLDQIVERD